MADKGKDITHLLDAYLREHEEILWISMQTRAPFGIPARVWAVILLGVVGILLTPLIGVPESRTSTLERVEVLITLVILSALVLGAVMLIMFLFRRASRFVSRRRLPGRVYAVTNQRLIYGNPQTVVTLGLEKVPPIIVFPGDNNQGTLSFGAYFPAWTGVEKPEAVKRLIEEAQQKHKTKTR